MTAQNGMTTIEAWDDFYQWATSPEGWKTIPPTGRDQIAKAKKAEAHPKKILGYNRIISLINRYAPGRYRIVFVLLK